ncbi:hypothetical protein GGR55DRAFT_487028 [Xylaria sp. FL0064]|nr:hypothetical protein GGR55DRAFT_487028 [Xylaria sp. FL0064]
MANVIGLAKKLKTGKVPRVAYVEDADDDGNILSGVDPIYSQNEIDEVPADSQNAERASGYHPQVFSHGPNPLRRPARYPTDFRNLEYKTISRDNTADENSRRAASFAYLGSKLTSCHDRGLKLKSMRPSLPIHKNEIPTTKTAYTYPKHPLRAKHFLCTYKGCERSIEGNGFPRQWNLRDHLRRVHGEQSRPEAYARVPPESFVQEINKPDSERADRFSGIKFSKYSWENSREDLGRMEDSIPFPNTNKLPEPDEFFQPEFTTTTFRNSHFNLSFGTSPRPPGGADLDSLPNPRSAPLSTPSTIRSRTPGLHPEYLESLKKKNRALTLSSNRATVDRHKPRSYNQLNLGVKPPRSRRTSPASSDQ